jgi:hypothetical protein
MSHGYGTLGFIAIMILYIGIGVLAAIGCIFLFRKALSPKAEQICYGLLLIAVAAFYLAFGAYFEAGMAWRIETSAVVAFIVLGLLGTRFPSALMVGYALHGAWDLLHELQGHGVHTPFEVGQLTAIPLAYGFFCVSFDFYVAGYFYTRRKEWRTASTGARA